MAGTHKLLRIFAEARLKDKTISSDMLPLDAVRQAEKDSNIHRIQKDTYMCAYRTNYEGKNALAIFITMKLPGSITGSCQASETVMSIVSILENIFPKIPFWQLEWSIKQCRVGEIVFHF